MTIGERIRNLMKERNLSQLDLAARTGIRQSSLSAYINDKYAPKQDKIYLIAKALNVSPAWLLDVESEGYYTDPDAAAYAEACRTNPNIRVLFSASKDISKEQMQKAVEYIEFLKAKEKGEDNL